MNNNIQKKERNIYAILGFIFSFIFSLVGLILSFVGLNKSKTTGNGRGLSVAGIIISILNIIITIIFLAHTTSIVNNNINSAQISALQNSSDFVAEWFEKEYSISKSDSLNYQNSVYSSYIQDHDFTSSTQYLTDEILNEIGVSSSTNKKYTIIADKSTIRLNETHFCVNLVAVINEKQYEKSSYGCQ